MATTTAAAVAAGTSRSPSPLQPLSAAAATIMTAGAPSSPQRPFQYPPPPPPLASPSGFSTQEQEPANPQTRNLTFPYSLAGMSAASTAAAGRLWHNVSDLLPWSSRRSISDAGVASGGSAVLRAARAGSAPIPTDEDVDDIIIDGGNDYEDDEEGPSSANVGVRFCGCGWCLSKPSSFSSLFFWGPARRRKPRQPELSKEERRASRAFARFIGEATFSLVLAMAGLGMVGVVLDHVQHFRIFKNVSELIILVPAILNLKGNLELSLAGRLSVAANTNSLSLRLIIGNIALMQVQAILAGLAGGIWVFLVGGISRGHFDSARDSLLVVSVSLITASTSSMASGILMSSIVLGCRRIGVDPDNIATPAAASLGDLGTLIILAYTSVSLGRYLSTSIPIIVGVLFCIPLPAYLWVVKNNELVRSHLAKGWSTLFLALAISTAAGLGLEKSIARFPGLALVGPVLTGVVGCAGTIHASRWATRLACEDRKELRRRSLAAHPDESARSGKLSSSALLPLDNSTYESARLTVDTSRLSDGSGLHERMRSPTSLSIPDPAGMKREMNIEDGECGGDDVDFDGDEDLESDDPTLAAEASAQLLSPWRTGTALFVIHLPVQWVFLVIIAFLNMAKNSHTGGLLAAAVPSIFGNVTWEVASSLASHSVKILNGTVANATATVTPSSTPLLSPTTPARAKSHSISVHDPIEDALLFVLMYTTVSGLTAVCVMWVAGALTRFCHRKGWSAAVFMPVIASISDVMGTGLLITGFFATRGGKP